MKATMITTTGREIKLSDDDYSRISKKTKDLGRAYQLNSGVIINLDQFEQIIPEADHGTPEVVEQIPENIPEASAVVEDNPVVLTSGEIRVLMEKHKLTAENFAKEIGYSQSSVRFALKGDRISSDFQKAVRARFPVEPVDNADAK